MNCPVNAWFCDPVLEHELGSRVMEAFTLDNYTTVEQSVATLWYRCFHGSLRGSGLTIGLTPSGSVTLYSVRSIGAS